jgi:hypothetical protein
MGEAMDVDLVVSRSAIGTGSGCSGTTAEHGALLGGKALTMWSVGW